MDKTASDHFAEANEFFVDEQFDEAAVAYDKAIEMDDKKATYYLHRAANHIKMENFLDAIPDCDKALKLDPMQHKAWNRKGTAYFEMDEFESALECFEKGKKMGNKHCDLQIRKCKVELKRENQESAVKTKKAPSTTTTKTATTSKKTTTNTTADTSDTSDDDEEDAEGVVGSGWHPKPKILEELSRPRPKVRVDWCQSNKNITITLFIKNMKKEDVVATCDTQNISCKLTLPDGDIFENKWFLWGAIKTKKFKFSVGKVKVELTAPKLKRGDWESLEDSVHEKAHADKEKAKRRQNLQTEYVQQKDKHTQQYWDDLDKQQKKEEEELKPEGQDAMDKLFKQIFRDATPETRRAMQKSYQTSGGTVLSTNWKEVSKTDYEKNITPPKGMEVRKYADEM